jgi:quercetin dioxygenase-like cupin family protein
MDTQTLWVLGHKVRVMNTDDSYALVEVTSPPRVPGPPPHHHRDQREFFLIIDGTLDVMQNGDWRRMSAGEYAELAPDTTHTFINNSDRDVVWVTGWRPKGFEKFFQDFGISAAQAGAQEKSVSQEVVQRVVQNVERYGMVLAR